MCLEFPQFGYDVLTFVLDGEEKRERHRKESKGESRNEAKGEVKGEVKGEGKGWKSSRKRVRLEK